MTVHENNFLVINAMLTVYERQLASRGIVLTVIKKFKSLIMCYLTIETKQNRTVNVAFGVVQTIKRKSHTIFAF